MQSVLFVCLGNICRSPLAEAIAKKISQERGLNILIDSAGTGDWHIGEAPCVDSIKVAKMHGVDISSLRARQVSKKDLEIFELMVALDEKNYADLKAMGANNIVKLGNYGYDGADIPDPYFFNGFEGFDKVYEMIEVCVNNLFKLKFENKE
ncbi:low molecular weight protein-tyrosine-phosphatase [Sulfurimonas paralvinellae]|uniref:protein-tyrosine-phosphatase n=1 Tax=Sulfurimonas paralvinellae TaxID=317658 RepID=A0A7M1B9I2_9BACT|nr:low molecular weight protein-tyrosine-phosphatase [Sulfurimonas paralvinellae]QOP46325.1 low molecular weight phosphotyrosine protein phosphatase [Sulfurimonas paralvinellae]